MRSCVSIIIASVFLNITRPIKKGGCLAITNNTVRVLKLYSIIIICESREEGIDVPQHAMDICLGDGN